MSSSAAVFTQLLPIKLDHPIRKGTTMEKQTRRGLLKNAAAAAGVTGAAAFAPEAKAQSGIVWQKKAIHRAPSVNSGSPAATPAAPAANAAPKAPPLFNGIVTFGNLVFIAGIGAHFQGTIEEHTKHVLDELEQNLILAGSSMEKVLKVNVYLSDLANYTKMNSVYAGRWGSVPPVRTTIAAAGGIPGDSLVEIDCIASL
jgi:2-iminobutanoate/2-iminopropanoate deaminase